ncbi:sensor histidine kinase [Bacillus massiliigorillae]|uniref:sensor histidine kinase n=1 Tax=Bacillus massiliigorillae TaxID=1243664 RepID=UPI0003A2BD5B|nr:sensor histidine kinase [Bacillus massiliigorillae]
MNERKQIIERLTGVQSSKRNYYTELKKTIIEMKKKNMQLEIINDVMKSLNVEMSMDEMLKNIMDKLLTIFPFDRISLATCKGEELILSNVYPKSLDYIKRGSLLNKEHSLYWKVINSQQMMYYTIQQEGEIESYVETKILQKNGIKTILLFPLFGKGKVVGILSFGSIGTITNEESDIAFLQQLSDHFGVCLENARLYNEVLNSKKQWEDTFRAVVDMILVVDLNGNILKVNDAAKQYFQLSEDNLSHKNICHLFSDNNDILQLLTDCCNTKEAAYQEINLANHTIFETFSNPIFNEEKQMYGVILYLKDVSEKRRIEAQLIHSGKLAAIGELAAGIAHELNNPLTAILGNSQLLLRNTNHDELSHKLYNDINNCGKRCKNIIQNLLTFSRQDEYLFQECSVNEAVDQILSLIGYQIEMQHINIVVKQEANLPKINGSLQQIGQIVINLVLNAKDSFENTKVRQKKIIVQTKSRKEEGKKWVYLTVQDNGNGICEDHLLEIFNPFFTTKQVGKGTGLGLSVSLGIAQAHSGSIEVMSVLGKGSKFILRLPSNQ